MTVKTGVLLGSIQLTLALSALAASAKTIEPGEDFMEGTKIEAGANGGVWKRESEENWKRGPITQIDVCHGARVDSIQVYYAGIAGTKFGGDGGNCDSIVLDADEYVTTIRVWSGDGLDAVQFVTNTGRESDRWGGAGGVRRLVQDVNKGALRRVDAKVGDYLDRFEFTYGLPYYVDNIDYKVNKDSVGAAKPKYNLYPGVRSCERGSQSTTVTISEATTSTHSWDFGWSLTVGVASEFTAGVPDVAQLKVSFSAESTIQSSESESYTTEKRLEQVVPVTAEEGEIVNVVARASMREVNLPFTYDLVYYRGDNKKNVAGRKTFDGVYKGVLVADYDVEKKVEACPGYVAASSKTPPVSTASTATSSTAANTATTTPAAGSHEKAVPSSSTPAKQTASASSEAKRAGASKPVKSNDAVTCVYATNGADETAFRLGDDGYWREETVDTGAARFTFAELERSDGEILLRDVDRGVLIGLDLKRGKVTYAESADGDVFDIYDITRTETR